MPTVDPQTGKRDGRAEPLLTLKKKRSGVYDFLPAGHSSYNVKEAFFAVGVRSFFQPGQKLRVGDEVFVHTFRDPKLVSAVR